MGRGYDPLREEAHWLTIILVVSIGLETAFALFISSLKAPALEWLAEDPLPLRVFHFTLPLLGLVAMLVFYTAYVLIICRARMVISRLRTTAHFGSAPTYHLIPSTSIPLTLPSTVSTSLGKGPAKRLAHLALWYTLFLVILNAIQIWPTGISFSSVFNGLASLAYYLLLALTIPLLLLVMSRWTTPMLTLTEESITARYGQDRITMRWDEVRSFAIIGRDKPNNTGVVFELSDGEHIIRWRDALSIGHPFKISDTEVEQYRELIQRALPSWICAKTGLPLYDLRTSNRFWGWIM